MKTKLNSARPIIGKIWAALGLLFILGSSNSALAVDQFLWTNGALTNAWTTPANWLYIPASGPAVVASFYPGENVGANPNGPKDDVALFNNITDDICYIDETNTGADQALQIGGIHIDGFEGDIIQKDDNRFNIAETADAGGFGTWDGTTTLLMTDPIAVMFSGRQAYLADFNFSLIGGGFYANPSNIGGAPLGYSMLVAVPFTIQNATPFRGPKDELRIRNNMSFTDGFDYDNVNEGAVVFSGRNGGLSAFTYVIGNVTFWDVKVSNNGGAGIIQRDFKGGDSYVANDFMTTGSLGVLGGASSLVRMNSSDNSIIHIRQDLIVGNVAFIPSFTAAGAIGDLVLMLDGTGDQTIEDVINTADFTGNLPAININKSSGDVFINGVVNVNNFIAFNSGIVYPAFGTANTQDDFTLAAGHFLLNSNATVINASDASYCNGPIRCRTGKDIVLPIGKALKYRPAHIVPVSGVSIDYSSDNMYTAEYFIGFPTVGTASLGVDMIEVSDCEAWAIQKLNTSDAFTFNLGLSYEPVAVENCNNIVLEAACLPVVSRWDNAPGEWVSHGGTGAGIGAESGLFSTINVTSGDFERSTSVLPDLFTFGDFTTPECGECGVSVYANYCVTDCTFDFEAIYITDPGSVITTVNWNFGDGDSGTGLMTSHTYASTGLKTVTLTICAIADGDECCATYTFNVFSNDCTPAASMAPVVGDGSESTAPSTLSSSPSASNDLSGFSLKVVPNPSSNGVVRLQLTGETTGNENYEIMDGQGKVLLKGAFTVDQVREVSTESLAPGIYFVTVYLNNEKLTERLVISQ